jgi:hypothetical protein
MCGGYEGSSKTEYNRMVWSRDGHIGNIKGHSRSSSGGSRCMVPHSSDMQDLSWRTIPRHLQDTTLPLCPRHLLLFLESRHQTHHYHALSTLMLLLPHISIPVTVHNTKTPTGRCNTITSLRLLTYPSTHHARLIIINTNGLVTAYMHSYHDTEPAPSQCQAL